VRSRARDPGREIEEAEVRRIAALAGLDLDEEEVRRLASEMTGVLTRFEAVELAGDRLRGPGGGEGTDGERAGGGEKGTIRPQPDVPGSDPLGREPREMAPRWSDGYFVVPRLRAGDP